VFPLHNLRYETEQTGVEVKREKAREPDVQFLPQDRRTTEYSTFTETGKLAVEIDHYDLFEIDDAVKLLRLFLREKDATLGSAWPKKRLKEYIVSRLKAAGQDVTFLSKENLLRLQQGFGPMFRGLDTEHPRMSQTAKQIVPVDLTAIPRQSFSESMLKQHGTVWYAKEEASPYGGQEVHLWKQYLRFCSQVEEYGDEASEQAKAIGVRIEQVDLKVFKSPWNVHYASHEPERKFSDLLFENSHLFDAFVKMPNTGGYAFPYSYKPAKAAITHVANENFNPDFFVKVSGVHDILVVEIKDDADDSNRNRAKCRDGLTHFETLNSRLEIAREPWRYYFYFLTPEDYTSFFEQIRRKSYAGWKSSLMQSFPSS
jgi:type III restriction enzyme